MSTSLWNFGDHLVKENIQDNKLGSLFIQEGLSENTGTTLGKITAEYEKEPRAQLQGPAP